MVSGIAFVSGVMTGFLTGLLYASNPAIRPRGKMSQFADLLGNLSYNKADQFKQTLEAVLIDGTYLVILK